LPGEKEEGGGSCIKEFWVELPFRKKKTGEEKQAQIVVQSKKASRLREWKGIGSPSKERKIEKGIKERERLVVQEKNVARGGVTFVRKCESGRS